MDRRNTIQRGLVLQAVTDMHRHVTAEEVYNHIVQEHPRVGKGTVYRNLSLLAEEGKIRRVEVPDGADRFDFMTAKHYHVRCVGCGEVFDVEMDTIPDLAAHISNTHGVTILDHDILFKGICPRCQQASGNNTNG